MDSASAHDDINARDRLETEGVVNWFCRVVLFLAACSPTALPFTEEMATPAPLEGSAMFVFDCSCEDVRLKVFVGSDFREPFAGFSDHVPAGAWAVDVPCALGLEACYGAVQDSTGRTWGRGAGGSSCEDCCSACVSLDEEPDEVDVRFLCP